MYLFSGEKQTIWISRGKVPDCDIKQKTEESKLNDTIVHTNNG